MNDATRHALRETAKLVGILLGTLAAIAAWGLPIMWAVKNHNIPLMLFLGIGLPMLVGVVWYFIETRNNYRP